MLKIYTLKTCDTCRKATRYLKKLEIPFVEIAIREQPPSIKELEILLASREGNIRALFNVSGGDYKAMGMKDRLPEMSAEQALELLAANGNLVKRPVLVCGQTVLNGFQEEEWDNRFS